MPIDALGMVMITHGEEFGEDRLLESMRRHRPLSSKGLLSAIVNDVQQFSSLEQHDDVTLIVARCQRN